MKLLSNDELWDIHCASLDILENTGVKIEDDEAEAALLEAGAISSGSGHLRIPARLVKQALDKCAPVVLLHGREDVPPLRVGGRRTYYGPCGFPTSVLDWRTGERRPSELRDLEEAARLTDMLDNIDLIQPPLSPGDVPVEYEDRYQCKALLLNTRKHITLQCYGEAGFEDIVAMASEVAGGTKALSRRPFLSIMPCITSPLVYRPDVCELIKGAADLSIPLFVMAGPMGGASAPATLAGTMAVGNAEVLAGIVMAKAFNDEASVIYTSWARTVDMKFGNVSLGAPEFAMLRVAAVQLADMYGLPSAGGGLLTDSKLVDAQAGYEKLGTALLTSLAGLNVIFGAGDYGAELVLSLEGYVIDNEVIGWVKRVVDGFEVDEDRLALALIAQQGPGGEYIATEHTRRYFQQEMWIPSISDRDSVTSWEARGCPSVRSRSQGIVRQKLDDHQPLDLADDMPERLQAIINRRMERDTVGD